MVECPCKKCLKRCQAKGDKTSNNHPDHCDTYIIWEENEMV